MKEPERIEYEFDYARLMIDISTKMGRESSLREIEAQTGISASVFSRINHGGTPDMDIFMRICAKIGLTPGDYFKRVVWMRKGE